jgi:hypothetical protein
MAAPVPEIMDTLSYIAVVNVTRVVSDLAQLFLRDPTKQVSLALHLKMEIDLISETLYFLVFRILGNGQSPETQ